MRRVSDLLLLIMVLLPISLMMISCKEESNLTNIETPSVEIMQIEPLRAKIGEDIRIVLKINDRNYIPDGSVYFNNCWNRADSIKGDTLYTFVPFIPNAPEEWKLEVSTSAKNYTYRASSDLSVETEVCFAPVSVKWNFLSPVSPEEANYISSALYKWEAQRNQDTIQIIRKQEFNDENNPEIRVLMLDKGKDHVPAHIAIYSMTQYDYGTGEKRIRIDTIKQALIRIDNWDSEGVLSGRIFPQVGEYSSGRFEYLRSADPYLCKYAFYSTVKK